MSSAAESNPTGRSAATAAVTAAALVVALVLLLAAAPLYTDDLWWHLTAGETYLREGLWPAGDGTLHTGLATGPVQHEWLFGVIVHLVDRVAGFPGLRVLHSVAVVLILARAWSVGENNTVFVNGERFG